MRVFRTILGMLLLTIGLPALLTGAALWVAMQHRDQGGAFSADLQQLSTPGYAIVVDDVDDLLRDNAPFARIGNTQVRLAVSTPAGPAFLGLAPTDQVQKYLVGVPHSTVGTVNLGTGALPVSTTVVAGAHGPTPAPEQAGFWSHASSDGTLAWTPGAAHGPYSLVVMGPGAKAGLQLNAVAELRPSWLNSSTWGLLTLGTLLVMVGLIALAWPTRRRDVVYVVEPSQVPDLMQAIGAPLPVSRGGVNRGGAHRPRTITVAQREQFELVSVGAPDLQHLGGEPGETGSTSATAISPAPAAGTTILNESIPVSASPISPMPVSPMPVSPAPVAAGSSPTPAAAAAIPTPGAAAIPTPAAAAGPTGGHGAGSVATSRASGGPGLAPSSAVAAVMPGSAPASRTPPPNPSSRSVPSVAGAPVPSGIKTVGPAPVAPTQVGPTAVTPTATQSIPVAPAPVTPGPAAPAPLTQGPTALGTPGSGPAANSPSSGLGSVGSGLAGAGPPALPRSGLRLSTPSSGLPGLGPLGSAPRNTPPAGPPTAAEYAAATAIPGSHRADDRIPRPGEPLEFIGVNAIPGPLPLGNPEAATESMVGRRFDRGVRRPTPSANDIPEFQASAVGAWVAETAAARARETQAQAAARLAEAARSRAEAAAPVRPAVPENIPQPLQTNQKLLTSAEAAYAAGTADARAARGEYGARADDDGSLAPNWPPSSAERSAVAAHQARVAEQRVPVVTGPRPTDWSAAGLTRADSPRIGRPSPGPIAASSGPTSSGPTSSGSASLGAATSGSGSNAPGGGSPSAPLSGAATPGSPARRGPGGVSASGVAAPVGLAASGPALGGRSGATSPVSGSSAPVSPQALVGLGRRPESLADTSAAGTSARASQQPDARPSQPAAARPTPASSPAAAPAPSASTALAPPTAAPQASAPQASAPQASAPQASAARPSSLADSRESVRPTPNATPGSATPGQPGSRLQPSPAQMTGLTDRSPVDAPKPASTGGIATSQPGAAAPATAPAAPRPAPRPGPPPRPIVPAPARPSTPNQPTRPEPAPTGAPAGAGASGARPTGDPKATVDAAAGAALGSMVTGISPVSVQPQPGNSAATRSPVEQSVTSSAATATKPTVNAPVKNPPIPGTPLPGIAVAPAMTADGRLAQRPLQMPLRPTPESATQPPVAPTARPQQAPTSPRDPEPRPFAPIPNNIQPTPARTAEQVESARADEQSSDEAGRMPASVHPEGGLAVGAAGRLADLGIGPGRPAPAAWRKAAETVTARAAAAAQFKPTQSTPAAGGAIPLIPTTGDAAPSTPVVGDAVRSTPVMGDAVPSTPVVGDAVRSTPVMGDAVPSTPVAGDPVPSTAGAGNSAQTGPADSSAEAAQQDADAGKAKPIRARVAAKTARTKIESAVLEESVKPARSAGVAKAAAKPVVAAKPAVAKPAAKAVKAAKPETADGRPGGYRTEAAELLASSATRRRRRTAAEDAAADSSPEDAAGTTSEAVRRRRNAAPNPTDD